MNKIKKAFDEIGAAIDEIIAEHQGLSIKDLDALAKARSVVVGNALVAISRLERSGDQQAAEERALQYLEAAPEKLLDILSDFKVRPNRADEERNASILAAILDQAKEAARSVLTSAVYEGSDKEKRMDWHLARVGRSIRMMIYTAPGVTPHLSTFFEVTDKPGAEEKLARGAAKFGLFVTPEQVLEQMEIL